MVVANQQDLNSGLSSITLGIAGLWVKAFIPCRTTLLKKESRTGGAI